MKKKASSARRSRSQQWATKKDMKGLERNIVDLTNEIQRSGEETRKYFEETKRHFDVKTEQLRHDYLGAHKDEVEVLKDARKDHERRIVRLEKMNFVYS